MKRPLGLIAINFVTKRTIIIPTFNEAQNIEALVQSIRTSNAQVFILVVDDNSPDGTAEIVKRLAMTDSRLSLLLREQKNGLGRAYIDAFKRVLEDPEVESIAMMDADFSHDPKRLPAMFERLSCHDVVVASRYVRGGGIVGWEFWRKLLSFFGNVYCKLILRMPLFDATSGFYCLRTEMLRRIDFESMNASGYAFQIEFKYLLWKHGARFSEFPIIFTNRVGGESKISGHIVGEGILAPWRMLFKK